MNPRTLFPFLLVAMVSVSCVGNGDDYSAPKVTPMGTTEYAAWIQTPQPDYIAGASKTPTNGDVGAHAVCAGIWEASVWQPGDEGYDIRSAFQSSARILINGHQVQQLKFVVLENLGAVTRYDKNGKSLGSYSGPDAACFDASNMVPSSYIATLQFTSTSGMGYSYSWLLTVPSAIEATPTKPPQ